MKANLEYVFIVYEHILNLKASLYHVIWVGIQYI